MNLLGRFTDCNLDADYDEVKKNFSLKIPANFNFSYDVIDVYAKEEPNKQAMVWCDDEGGEKFFSFKDISDMSKKTANFFVQQGIKKGDRVMLFLRRRYEFWWIVPALHRIGAIVIPATTQLLKHDIVYRNNAADIKMIVALDNKQIEEEMEAALPESPTVEKLVTVSGPREGWVDFHAELEKQSVEFDRPTGEAATCNEDPMLIYFTSGTSGYPKMVAHNFLYPLGHIITAKYWQRVIDGGLHCSVAETGWGKAVWGKLYGQWISGSSVFVYDLLGFTPNLFFSKIAKYKVTTLCAPPSAYRFLIRQDLSKYDLSNLTYFVTAGEALNDEVFKKFLEKTGHEMREGYGQTETTLAAGTFPGMKVKPGSMGKAAPGFDLEIVDENGKHCAPNVTGNMIIHLDKGKPLGLFGCYYKNEPLTKEALGGSVYNTGDLAYYDEDGYIWFVGRQDDVIKSTGYRISPFEVESVLMRFPGVLECAVTGVADKSRGQIVKATIVLTEEYKNRKDGLEKEIMTYARSNLATYKIPRLIEFVDELPKTISGKIRRVEIRQKDQK